MLEPFPFWFFFTQRSDENLDNCNRGAFDKSIYPLSRFCMSRHVRHQKKGRYYHISNRTRQARYYLRPDEELNRIALGCLARAAALKGVTIICFCFMSNHFHLIIRLDELELSEFMREFQGELARRTNDLRGQSGSFYQGRFNKEPILDAESVWDKIAYTLCNPIEARLVRDFDRWPGISSWDAHGSDGRVVGQFLNKSQKKRYERRGIKKPKKKALSSYSFQLGAPPGLEGESYETVGRKIREYAKKRRTEILERHSRTLKGRISFLGPRGVLSLDPSDRPKNPAKSPQPACHTVDPNRRAEYKKMRKRVTSAYRRATEKLRAGKPARFPAGTIPHSWSRPVDPERDTGIVAPPNGPPYTERAA